jgi:hypothetical protein
MEIKCFLKLSCPGEASIFVVIRQEIVNISLTDAAMV